MALTNLFLLDNVVYGTPSGNYDGSSADFNGDGVKAVGYYQGQGNLQTVLIRVNGFVGTVTLQGTLDFNWQSADWFDLYEYGDNSSATTDVHPVNLTGNFTWVRARVTNFDAGTIESVTISY